MFRVLGNRGLKTSASRWGVVPGADGNHCIQNGAFGAFQWVPFHVSAEIWRHTLTGAA